MSVGARTHIQMQLTIRRLQEKWDNQDVTGSTLTAGLAGRISQGRPVQRLGPRWVHTCGPQRKHTALEHISSTIVKTSQKISKKIQFRG